MDVDSMVDPLTQIRSEMSFLRQAYEEKIQDLVAPDSYADETEGFSAGVQAEAWW